MRGVKFSRPESRIAWSWSALSGSGTMYPSAILLSSSVRTRSGSIVPLRMSSMIRSAFSWAWTTLA